MSKRVQTQVGRALAHLGVEHIAADSPEARAHYVRATVKVRRYLDGNHANPTGGWPDDQPREPARRACLALGHAPGPNREQSGHTECYMHRPLWLATNRRTAVRPNWR